MTDRTATAASAAAVPAGGPGAATPFGVPGADPPDGAPGERSPAGPGDAAPSGTAPPGGGAELALRMPSWLGTVRFRLTLIYSLVLFGLAAMVVGGLYATLARDLADDHVARTYVITQPVYTPQGIEVRQETIRAEFETLEQLVNQRALLQLRNYSFIALALLFLSSLGVGWFVAGRALAPIGRITAVARAIQATDLSRRISLGGPNDELRDLADTFDDMLGRLEEAFEAQRRFVQDASHELRNPLAVMQTNLDVALADPSASAEELRRTAVVVERTTKRMGKLVEDLLAHARQGLAARAWERVELAAVIEETADELDAVAVNHSLTLVTRTTPGVVVSADRDALKQALANLVGNAIRLAPSATTVTLSSGVERGWAFLAVADQGPGIAVEDQPLVFERFWRAPDQVEPDDGGTRGSGLGLTIVNTIAEAHGGRVDLASVLGQGSTFVLWLPAL
ncbi:MAG: ATP-binding protein [Acidimicrobiia bacterium]